MIVNVDPASSAPRFVRFVVAASLLGGLINLGGLVVVPDESQAFDRHSGGSLGILIAEEHTHIASRYQLYGQLRDVGSGATVDIPRNILDEYVLEPVATGWDVVVPEVAQTGVRNFFDNLTMPVTLVNDILQLKPLAAMQDLSRIVINTTAGIGGLLDVATMIEIPKNDEDFGQTLARYGVPPGPYLMIPILGPSTVRDVWMRPEVNKLPMAITSW